MTFLGRAARAAMAIPSPADPRNGTNVNAIAADAIARAVNDLGASQNAVAHAIAAALHRQYGSKAGQVADVVVGEVQKLMRGEGRE